MNSLSLWAAILFWGGQISSGGSITGTVRAQTGGPATGVRVVAIAVPNTAGGAAESVVFESITQSDSTGHYRLDNIAPGRYYIAAGPVSLQTFHPGTSNQSEASMITITRNSPLASLTDFTLRTASPSDTNRGWVGGPQGTLTCCSLMVKFLMEDKSTVPDFPSLSILDRRGSGSSTFSGNLNRRLSVAALQLTVPLDKSVEIAVEGLPPGYILKAVAYGGKDFGLNPFLVDGKSLATLDLTLGYELAATSQKVTVRGKVLNPPRELNMTSIRFISTIPRGPSAVARLEADGTFELAEIPVGAYWTGGVVGAGPAVRQTILVIRDNVSGLAIDFQDNPFPEFVAVHPERTAFTDGSSIELTGVITQRLTKFGTSDSAYFRMNVKDASTGAVTPWAVFVEHAWQTPRITVGETLTVPGVPGNDGTSRLSAYPF